MSSSNGGGVRTVAELGRRFDEFLVEYREDRQEMRALAAANVTREVYHANQLAMDAKVEAVRAEAQRDIEVLRADHAETKGKLQFVTRLVGGAIGTGLISGGLAVLVQR